MTRIDVHPDFQRQVLAPLASAGRALHRRAVVQGICRTAAILVAALFVQFALDALLVLGTGPRAALLLLVLGMVAHQAWKFILAPLGVRVGPLDVAEVMERKYPSLGDRLVSAVSFATAGIAARDRDSPALVGALMSEARGAFARVEVRSIFARRRHRKCLAAGLGAALAGAAAAAAFPELASTFFARNLALADVPWPTRVRLVLEGFENDRLRWPLGDELTLVATAVDDVPPGVRAEIETTGGASAEEGNRGDRTMRDLGRRGERQFVLQYGPLQSSFRVRFSIWRLGVDERTGWYTVEGVERPSIRDVTIAISPPDYTGISPFNLARGQTSADVLRGSRATIDATVSKPVARAELRMADRAVAPAEVTDATRVTATFAPSISGSYFFDLADDDGLTDTRPVTYAIRLVADPPPKVKLTLPGTGEMLVPDAILDLAVECEDALGLKSVELVHQVSPGRATEKSPPEPEMTALPNLAARQTKYTLRTEWPLLPLTLKPGDQLTLKTRASDYQPAGEMELQSDGEETGGGKPIGGGTAARVTQADSLARPEGRGSSTGGANVGESVAYSFRIVTPEELTAELARRENEWRREFEQIIKSQEQGNARVADLMAADAEERASSSHDARLAQEARAQRQQAGRMRTVHRQFEQILAEMEVNRLANAAVRRRLRAGVIDPMRRLIDEDVPQAAALMDDLRSQYDADRRDELSERQVRLLRAMYGILSNMLKWEGYDEAVSLLRDIIRLQGEINEDTQKRMQEEIDRLFRDVPDEGEERRP